MRPLECEENMKASLNMAFVSVQLDGDRVGIVAGVPETEQLDVVRFEAGCGGLSVHAVPRNLSVSASAAADMNLQCAIRQARQ